MFLHRLLAARAAAGNPIRVGVVGAGKFGTMFLAQARRTPGLHVLAVADLSPDRARAALDRCGWPAAQYAARGFAAILLDPPRDGAFEVVKEIHRLGAQRLVYVSCNPATLARDAAELVRQGYRLKRAGILDMFPQTAHVEAMALFERG